MLRACAGVSPAKPTLRQQSQPIPLNNRFKIEGLPNKCCPRRIYGEPFSPKGVWVEGATTLRVDGYCYDYFDCYAIHRYGAMRTKDFKSWEDVSDRLKVPEGMRHGTALEVSQDVLDKLLEQK